MLTRFFYFCCVLITMVFTSCNSGNDEPLAYGNFESDDVIVSAENAGKILMFQLTEGQILSKGAAIGYTDTIQLYLKKMQVSAAISSIEVNQLQLDAQIQVNRISYRNVKKELDRFSSLASEGAATAKQADDLSAQLDLLDAQMKVLEAQKKMIRAETITQGIQLAQIEDQLKRSYFTSPISGKVLETYVREGELAQPGKALYKIADPEKIILRVFLSGDQLSSVKTGDEIRVFFDGEDKQLNELKGKITWISEQAEFTPKIIQTRKERVNLVYAMKVEVQNDGRIKIGMPGEVSLLK